MSVLSAQSIRRLCDPEERARWRGIGSGSPLGYALNAGAGPMISPFTERGVVNGKSYGLSACTYDCRIDQDLILEPMPFGVISRFMNDYHGGDWARAAVQADLTAGAKFRALASTIERFSMPFNVCGSVLDKSSYARVFVSAFNTHLDPGWDGFLTVELVNLGPDEVNYRVGDPVCQIKFEWLDEPTDLPYIGRKYSDQPRRPVAAIAEDENLDRSGHLGTHSD